MEETVRNLLPEKYDFKIENICSLQGDTAFNFIIRMKAMSEAELQQWRLDFQLKTCSNWIVYKTNNWPTKLQFVKHYVCHHNKFNKTLNRTNETRNKNTCCEARMSIKVKLVTKITQMRDAFIRDGYPTCVEISWNHNHPLLSADALSYLPMSNHVKEKFIEYFNSGMSVKQVLAYHQMEVEVQEDFNEKILANAALFPKDDACWRIYNDWRKSNPGERGNLALKKLEEKIPELKRLGIAVEYSESPPAIVIVTPVMLRAHQLKSSSEIVFVDSTSCCDDDNNVLTFFLCATPMGAVPLAVLITKGQSEKDYSHGFSLLKILLGDQAFNGSSMPKIFMTDDSAAEKMHYKRYGPFRNNISVSFMLHKLFGAGYGKVHMALKKKIEKI